MVARKKTFWCLGNEHFDGVRSWCTLGMCCGRQQLVEEKKQVRVSFGTTPPALLVPIPVPLPPPEGTLASREGIFSDLGVGIYIYMHSFKKCLASLVLFLYLSDIILFAWKPFHFSCGSIALSLPAA